jgi:hypothetical protein
MKPFGILKLPMILAGVGASRLPQRSRSEQRSLYRFGLQNVTTVLLQNRWCLSRNRSLPRCRRARTTTNPVTLEATAQRAPVLSAEEFTDKRNAAPKAPKKQWPRHSERAPAAAGHFRGSSFCLSQNHQVLTSPTLSKRSRDLLNDLARDETTAPADIFAAPGG